MNKEKPKGFSYTIKIDPSGYIIESYGRMVTGSAVDVPDDIGRDFTISEMMLAARKALITLEREKEGK